MPAPIRNLSPKAKSPPSSPHGRMTPISHSGPLPWIQLRNAVFHPSIFKKMLGRLDTRIKNGDLAFVYDRDGQPFGTGLFSSQSAIGLRMLTFDATPVDESIIPQRLANAIELRRDILNLDKTTNAYRVVHAEGDGLPGLIVDRFDDYAVIELFSFPMFRRLDTLRETLTSLPGVKEVLARADERVQNNEGFILPGSSPAGPTSNRAPDRKSTIITENSLRFQIDLTHGHKTGFFCDQRDNRLALTHFTPEREVLDLCSYSGGFGVYAATLGKASSVTCVDLDEDAIALAQRNANLNKIPRDRFTTLHSDAFPYLRQLQQSQKQVDIVILDPPKLIPTREDIEEGRTKYYDLNRLALTAIKPGGLLVTCSCSGLLSPEDFFTILKAAARGARRRVQVFNTTGASPDHPVMTDHPESAYLKCLWCRVW